MNSQLIAISTFCSHHRVTSEFIFSLENEGLISLIRQEEDSFIDEEQLHQLEVYTSWYELGINTAGIETISYLVQKLRDTQAELNLLKQKMRRYEEEQTGMEI